MRPLLFLAHRLPYPPNKGDKVRSCHFLHHLAEQYRIFLGTFIDDPQDWQHVENLNAVCAEVHVEPIAPGMRRALSAAGLFRGEALTLAYFRSSRLRRWVEEVVAREQIAHAFAFSSPMAQYVAGMEGLRTVLDFVDMDSAKWGDYARAKPWPVSVIYRRECTRLLAYEHAVGASADAVVFVTQEESNLYRNSGGRVPPKAVTICNGVDAEYFSPSTQHETPFTPDERAVVFTGAMDYWPNIDAVVWFARDVLPLLRAAVPSLRFYVVGMNPSQVVRDLAKDPGVRVTGRVDDVRPFLQHAACVVAPLRVARGIQNKVLEAMAMGKATVVTTAAAAGLQPIGAGEIIVADTANEFARRVQDALDPVHAEAIGRKAREMIVRDFAWQKSYEQLDALLEGHEVPDASLRHMPQDVQEHCAVIQP